ncbi:MAG: type II toxin-antitoxin system RelE/ParE family toxin [Theionarchaea archaeon]|nr:type II toxin-antitoxin system RelE/ParE family toxin [Theionarchaea archaeon]
MNYSILLHPKANIFLDKLDQEMRKRIRKKLEELQEYPERGNHLRYSVFWSLRVGDYRIIYEIDKKEQKVIILFIGHRKDVYDDFSKLF